MFDIWRQVGCFPQMKTLLFAWSKTPHFSFSCWSYSFSLPIFGHLIDLAVVWAGFVFFLQPFYSWFFSLRPCSFLSGSLLISKLILLLFQSQMKSVLTFYLSFWAPPPFYFLLGMWDEISDVLSNIILLTYAFSSCSPLIHAGKNPTFSPLSTIHLPFPWCLERAERNSQGQTDLFICVFSCCVSRFHPYWGVHRRNSSLFCRRSLCDSESKVPLTIPPSVWNW